MDKIGLWNNEFTKQYQLNGRITFDKHKITLYITSKTREFIIKKALI